MRKPNGNWTFEDCLNEAKKYHSVKEFRELSHNAYTAAIKHKWIEQFDFLHRTRQNNNFWDRKHCLEEARKYTSRGEFAKNCQSAYNSALKNNWLDDYTWFSPSASKKKWTYETCKEESKKYTTRTEFHDGNSSAYKVSCLNKWIDDFTWLVDGNEKRIKWTYDRCFQEAKKYSRIADFAKYSPGAYNASIKNKWRDDYIWLPHSKIYSYEEVYGIAKQYQYKVDFQKNDRGAYDAALHHDWLKDFDWFFDGIKRTGERHRKWNYDSCFKEASKYTTRGEFGTKSARAYVIAYQNGWINDYVWLIDKRLDLYNDKIDCIYVYEFSEFQTAYVGRTLIDRKKDRDREHLYVRNDAVAKFANQYNVEVPLPIYLEEFSTIKEGVDKECYWIERYKEMGWHLLNKMRGGSIGGLGKGKWNYKACLEEAKKFDNLKDFRIKATGAYNISIKKGWIKDFTWLKHSRPEIGYYTYEKCMEIADGYDNMAMFRKEQSGAYNSAKKHGWLSEYVWLVKQFKWTKETLLEEAKKYKTRSEFAREKPGAYEYAQKHSLLDKCTWFDDVKKPNGYWTFERCQDESKKYEYRGDYRKGSNGSYKVALKNGWIDGFTWLKKKVTYSRRIWTEEKCRNEALKYKSVSEFKKGNKSAYKAATRYKWLKEYRWLKGDANQLDLFDD